jgi:hypothetical protein
MASKNFIIPLIPFPFDVMVSLNQQNEELDNELKKYSRSIEDDDILKELGIREKYGGRTVKFIGGETILRLNFVPRLNNPFEMALLQHEIFHVIEFLLVDIGITLNNNTSEIYAYMLQNLTSEVYKHLISIRK